MAPGGIDTAASLWYGGCMDISLPAPFRTTGRAERPVSAALVRELDEADIAALGTERGTKAPPLKRIGDRHHALARSLASGMSSGEAAIVCGVSPSRVSILLDDPAFQELLTFYRREVNEAYRGLHERLAGISLDAADLLQDQLEADMEKEVEERKLSPNQLMEIMKTGADRTGFGPQSSSTNVNLNVDLAGKLEAARLRVMERKRLDG